MEDHFLYGRWSCSQLNVLGTSNYHGLHTERTGEDDVQWDSAARAEKLLWHRWIEEIHRNHPCNIPKAIFTYICLICMVNVGKYTLHRWDGYSFFNHHLKWWDKLPTSRCGLKQQTRWENWWMKLVKQKHWDVQRPGSPQCFFARSQQFQEEVTTHLDSEMPLERTEF